MGTIECDTAVVVFPQDLTADQYIAFVGVVSGGVVGLAGVVFAGFSGWRDRKAARVLADRERTQQRLADAYIDLLIMSEKVGHWCAKVRPVVDTGQKLPDIPTVDEQILARTKARAYGSDALRGALETWIEAVNAVMSADHLIGMRQRAADEHVPMAATLPATTNRSYMDVVTPMHTLDSKLRPAERTAREAMAKIVEAELK